MKVKRVWLSLALSATLLVFGVLALVAWDFVREAIVVPLAYLIWLGELLLKSISQEIYLVLLIVFSSAIALNTVNKLQGKGLDPSSFTTAPEDAARYRLWLKLCTASHSSEYSRLELAREVRKLILSLLAYQEGLSPAAVEQKIVSGDLAAPAAIRKLIRERDLMSAPRPEQRFWRRLIWKRERPVDPLLNQSLEEIVHFIENRLEIIHAGTPLSSPD